MDKTKNKWDEQYVIDVGHLNVSVKEQDSKQWLYHKWGIIDS